MVELRLRSASGRGLLVATVLGSGIAILDTTVVNVALPHLGADLHASMQDLQWTVNAYTLPLAALVLLGGALGDRFGRRRVFLLGVLWFSVASVLCGLSPNVGVLVAGRAWQGIGGALLTPGSLALIQSSLHPEDRARAIGAWAGLGAVAAAVGPLVGGWLIDVLSWRWAFFLNVPFAVVVLAVAVRYIPESRDETDHGRFDVAGATLGALGLAGITYALILGARPTAVPAAALGVAALAGFVAVERRSGEPMLPPALFASRDFSVLNAFTFVTYAALGGTFFFLVLQMQIVAGFSALAAGAAPAPVPLLLLAGSSWAGALGKRIGPRIPLTAGCLVATAGVLLMRRIGPGAVYWRDVLPAVILMGVGLTLFVAPLTASVLAAAETRYAGVASGVNNAVARTGGLLAVAALPLLARLSGTDYENPAPVNHAYQTALAYCAGLFVVGAALSSAFLSRSVNPADGVNPRDG